MKLGVICDGISRDLTRAIDVMDEFLITQIAKYFPIDEGMMPLEKKLVADKLKL